MGSNEMVERVAGAIWWENYGRHRPGRDKWPDDVIGGSQELFRAAARAAIAEMREPTDGMRKAVEEAEDDMGVCHAAYENIGWHEAWPVAIDAALNEDPT